MSAMAESARVTALLVEGLTAEFAVLGLVRFVHGFIQGIRKETPTWDKSGACTARIARARHLGYWLQMERLNLGPYDRERKQKWWTLTFRGAQVQALRQQRINRLKPYKEPRKWSPSPRYIERERRKAERDVELRTESEAVFLCKPELAEEKQSVRAWSNEPLQER